ncbi:alpha/beta hydrolase [Salinisphaera sp. Q1T1-3]|uniref:alpha/beta hydrolase n=1 Tax=Salinisphaera sp. Q1T1-3 TaxID=2321229 RepID=UPI000E72C5F2|nr:hypothetical protein D3260_13005 [Salinisphaera sp. Q1T1-3]
MSGVLVAGARDPLTRARVRAHFLETHPHIRSLAVPGGGHGVLRDSDCARRAIRAWLAGRRWPDAACKAAEHAPYDASRSGR